MKKGINYIASFSLLVLVIVSCGPSAAEKEAARVRRSKTPNPIVWDTLSITKNQPLDAKGVMASCALDISYIIPKEYVKQQMLDTIQMQLNSIVLGDENGYKTIAPLDAMTKYAESYVVNYKKEVKSQLPLWNKINGNAGNAYFSYNKKIETEVLYSEANLISYQVRTIETKGDSTSTTIISNLVFDLTNGNRLKQRDIFKKETIEKLNKIIIAQILKDKKVENIEDLQTLGYWGVADLAANNNFYVDKDGITYTYNPNEYSDAELGVLKVFINYDNMMDIFKDASPISILIHDLD